MSPLWRRPGWLLGLAALAGGTALAARAAPYLVQVLGTALALGGAAFLVALGRPALRAPLPERAGAWLPDWTWGRLLAEAAGPLLLLGALVALYHPLLAGQMPWQGDHTVHEAKAFLLSERLLPSGRLMGWTHQSGTGYPAEVLYPPLGDLWVTAVRLLTFRQLSFGATYGLAFFGVIAFGVLAFYGLGRRLFGPLAGFVAGLGVLTDPGGFREGGYVFTVQYGVWPLHLGVVLSFLAAFALHGLLRKPGWRGLGRTALLTAAALLAHPVSLIFFLVAYPSAGLLALARSRPEDPPVLGRLLATAGLGAALAACWLLPFLAKAPDFSAHVSNYWKPMRDIGAGLVDATLWQGSWAWLVVLAGVGGWLALRERRPAASLLLALAAAFLLAGSLTAYAGFRLPEWIASARYVQFQRFVVFVKLASFLLAGLAVQRLAGRLAPDAWDAAPGAPPPASGAAARRSARTGDPPLPRCLAGPDRVVLRRLFGWGLAVALAAPFLLPVTWSLVEDRVLPVGRLTYAKDKAAFVRDFRALMAQVCREARRPDAPFFRVGFWGGFNDHEMANARTFCPELREVKLSFIPSETFRYRAHLSPSAVPRSREDFRALNLRYVLSNGTRPVPGWLRPVARRGRLALYAVPDANPLPFTVLRRVAAPGQPPRFEPVPPAEVPVTLVRFDDQEVVVRARAVPPDHYLVLHVAHFANWRADRDGRPLPITPVSDLAPRVPGLMRVPLADGVTRFAYRATAADWLGRVLSGLALIVLIGLWQVRRRPEGGVARRLRAAAARLLRPPVVRAARGAFFATLAGLGVLLAARASGCAGGAPRTLDLAVRIAQAEVSIRRPGGRVQRCTTFQMGRWICGPGRRFVGPVAEEWNLKNRLGLWAHPPARGTLVIRYPDLRLGRRLEIDYGILQSGGTGAPVQLDVFVAGEPAGTVRWPVRRGPPGWAPRPLVLDTHSRAGARVPLRFEVHTAHIGGRHFVFHPRIVY